MNELALKAVALALSALALFLLGRTYGQHQVYNEWIAANTAAQVASTKIIVKTNEVTVKRLTEYRNKVVYIEREAKEVSDEVQTYKTNEAAAGPIVLPVDWVRVHDRSASGTVPGSTPRDDGAGATATSGEALEAVTDNYTTHHRLAARLVMCQAWVREQYQTINGTALGY